MTQGSEFFRKIIVNVVMARIIGVRLFLFTGDCLVLDRWLWMRRYLERTKMGLKLLDVGCGAGTFSLLAAKRGYSVTGITYEADKVESAKQRAKINGIFGAEFLQFDIRRLSEKTEWREHFDIIINTENLEHILDDKSLVSAMANLLKPRGYIIFTAPYLFGLYDSIGPTAWQSKENGGHVRRGYALQTLTTLFSEVSLDIEVRGFVSGRPSILVNKVYLHLVKMFGLTATSILTLPLRLLPAIFSLVRPLSSSTGHSIALILIKR